MYMFYIPLCCLSTNDGNSCLWPVSNNVFLNNQKLQIKKNQLFSIDKPLITNSNHVFHDEHNFVSIFIIFGELILIVVWCFILVKTLASKSLHISNHKNKNVYVWIGFDVFKLGRIALQKLQRNIHLQYLQGSEIVYELWKCYVYVKRDERNIKRATDIFC